MSREQSLNEARAPDKAYIDDQVEGCKSHRCDLPLELVVHKEACILLVKKFFFVFDERIFENLHARVLADDSSDLIYAIRRCF